MHSFRREKVSEQLFEELMPLFAVHHAEVDHYKEIPLSVNTKRYLELEEAGTLRVFTARLESGQLVGYAFFFVSYPLHNAGSLQAVQDAIFIHPNHRGQKGSLVAWCDEQLKDEGVQVVYQHIKASHNFGPMLERLGYELVDLIYGKRLTKAAGV
jgi:GNAT superfamily N-acetyltransferase